MLKARQAARSFIEAMRHVLWLIAFFALVETPLGRGDLFASDGRLLPSHTSELSAGDLPLRHSTPGSKKRFVSLIDTSMDWSLVAAADENGGDLVAPSPADETAGSVLPPQDGFEREALHAAHIGAGYASRAPPARA